MSKFKKTIINKIKLRKLKKSGLTFGKNLDICGHVNFGSEPFLIFLGDDVRITEGVSFITHDGGVAVVRRLYNENSSDDVFGKIVVGNNVHIGTNSIIMPNVTIGNNVVIGCGSIVTHDVPNNCVVAGSPAKIIESLEEYKTKIDKKAVKTKHLSYKEKRLFLEKYFDNKNGTK